MTTTDTQRSSRTGTLVLVLLCLAEFMVALDFAIMNVMLPSLREDVAFSQSQLQWVVSAYAIAFGGFLLLGGRAADLFGRKRMLLAGIVGFTAVSAVAGTLDAPWQLIAARATQGACAALVTPAAFSLLTRLFSEESEREKAMGAWGAVLGLGFVSGVVAGGFITDYLGWSWVFWLNIPVGTALVAAIVLRVPNAEADDAGTPLDVPGAVLGTAAVIGLVYALTNSGIDGWGSAATLAALGAAVLLATLFVLVESRQAAPLVPPRAIRARSVAVVNLSNGCLMGGFFGLLFMLTLFLQQSMHFSPLRTGLTLAAAGIAGLVAGIVSPLVARRVGVRRAMVGGAVVQSAATAALMTLPQVGTQVLVASLMVVVNFSGVVALVMLNITAMHGVAAQEQGFVGGLLLTCEQVGGALGLALVAAVASSQTSGGLDGYRAGIAVAAALTLAGGLMTLLLPRTVGASTRPAAAETLVRERAPA